MNVPDRLLTCAEVAELLGLKESWIAEQARLGRVPHCRFGRYRRFTAKDVEAILRSHRSQAA